MNAGAFVLPVFLGCWESSVRGSAQPQQLGGWSRDAWVMALPPVPWRAAGVDEAFAGIGSAELPLRCAALPAVRRGSPLCLEASDGLPLEQAGVDALLVDEILITDGDPVPARGTKGVVKALMELIGGE